MSATTKKTTEEIAPEPKPAKGTAKAPKAAGKPIKPATPEKSSKGSPAGGKPAKETPTSEKPSKKEKAAVSAADGANQAPTAPPREGPRGRSSHAKQYRPEDKYKVGDVLYHPVWQEEGTVIEVGKTPGDIDKIVVEFDRLGIKRLVANYSSTMGSDED